MNFSLSAANRLIFWFQKNKRDFPWRRQRDPYSVWLAEIMSQQTVMAALLPYYHRFMERFPSLSDLAQATEEDVLKAWAGLGYYSRARNLHRAAQKVFAAGKFPETYEQWLELPGVGPYTAAAVVSQCFEAPQAVWDGNVLRVSSRFWAVKDVHNNVGFKNMALLAFNQVLQKLVEQNQKSSEFNQGLMELGSLVCTPQNPRCDQCPLLSHCQAFKLKMVNELPPPKPRKDAIQLNPRVFVLLRKSATLFEVFLEERQSNQWFGGLWDFPSELGGKSHPLQKREIEEHLAKISKCKVMQLKSVRHQVTHHRFDLDPYVIELETLQQTIHFNGRWFSIEKLIDDPVVPLATTAKKVLRVLMREDYVKSS